MKYRSYYLHLLFALLLTGSCTNDLAEESGFGYSADDTQDEREEVRLFMQMPQYIVEEVNSTKGTGAFDPDEESDVCSPYWKHKKDARYYVYGFRSNGHIDYSQTIDEDYTYCLIDNPDNYYQGLPARIDENGNVTLTDEEDNEVKVMYGNHKDFGYSFFVYYIDNLPQNQSTVIRNSGSIGLRFKIDGTQDILTGYSVPLDQITLKNSHPELSDKEIEKIVSIGYGPYAAHRGIYPKIYMTSVFTRFKFLAYPGDNQANRVTINKIGIRTKTNGILTLVSNSAGQIGHTTWDASYDYVYLHEKYNGTENSEIMAPVKMNTTFNPHKEWRDQEETRLGESILVPPANSYEISIWISRVVDKADGTGTEIVEEKIVKRISHPFGSYSNKYNYLVKLKVNGVKEEITSAREEDVLTAIVE